MPRPRVGRRRRVSRLRVDVGFPEALLLIGALLTVAAGLSGWLNGTVLSISVLSVVAGIGLAWGGVIAVSPGAEIVVVTVELALVLTLSQTGWSSSASCCARTGTRRCGRSRSPCP